MPCDTIYTVAGILDLYIGHPRDGKHHCLAKTKKSGGKDQCARAIASRKQEQAWYLLRECMSCADLDDQAVRCHTRALGELLIHSFHPEARNAHMAAWTRKILAFQQDPRNRHACRRPLVDGETPLPSVPIAYPSLPYVMDDPVEPAAIMIRSPGFDLGEQRTIERYRSRAADPSGRVSTHEPIDAISTSNPASHALPGNDPAGYGPITLFTCLFGRLMHVGSFGGLCLQLGVSLSSPHDVQGSLVYLKFELGMLAQFLPLVLLGIVSVMIGLC